MAEGNEYKTNDIIRSFNGWFSGNKLCNVSPSSVCTIFNTCCSRNYSDIFLLIFSRIKHLILADPWGFPERPTDLSTKSNIPLWVKAIALVISPLNPLWAVRAAGPFGQWVVEKARPDITRKFSVIVEEDNLIPQYIHQCNSQQPS